MVESVGDADLSIGELSRHTGLSVATIRSWEQRHHFPRAHRAGGGHRRYSADEMRRVLEVVRWRESGLGLAAAIRQLVPRQDQPASVYAALRRAHPEIALQQLTKRTLTALSRAIEDEAASSSREPLLFGAFQRLAFLEASLDRWVELSRTAAVAVVFAVGADAVGSASGLQPVALPDAAPMSREWIVICDSAEVTACLVGTERPGQMGRPDGGRPFDPLGTVEPSAVRTASRLAAGVADGLSPGWRAGRPLGPLDRFTAPSLDLERMGGLMVRSLSYVQNSSL